ncbi:MAG: hypothetical protein Q9221_006965 [Calogaya cf. arnoldii]
MERATPSPDADDVAVQFERDWIASPAHHHGPVLDNTSGDEDPLDLTLALNGPVPTEEEAEVASFVNSVAIPTENHEQAKRKRSGSTDRATPELAKRPRTQDAHSRDKLHRPGSQLVKKSAAPVNRADIFAVPDQDEDNYVPIQAPKVTRPRGRPRKNKESSTALADLRQTSVLSKPDIAATAAAPPPPARMKGSTPPQQPKRPQTRSRKPLLAASSDDSPRPVKQPEVAHPPSANQAGIVHENQLSNGGEALANEPPTGKTKRGFPGNPEPTIPRQDPGKDGNVSKVRTGAQAWVQQLEDDREEGDPIDNANIGEDDPEQHSDYEDSGPEREASGNQTAHDSDTSSDDSELNLLGQDDAWTRINKARREIGVSRIKKQRVKEIPKMSTEHGKRIVEIIKAAEEAYDPASQDECQGQLQQALQSLSRCVEDLSEDSCPNEESEVIQDVYAHAIPKLVLLLNKAFSVRSTQLSRRKDTSTLAEIIGLQEALITLCQKTREWKAEPMTSRPIIKPTRTMFPLIKQMRHVLVNELEDRKRIRKERANKTNLQPKVDQARMQRAMEKRKREDWAIRQHIVDDCNRGSQRLWRPVHELNAQHATAHAAPNQSATARPTATTEVAVETWPKEQQQALLTELVRKEHCNLTGKAAAH